MPDGAKNEMINHSNPSGNWESLREVPFAGDQLEQLTDSERQRHEISAIKRPVDLQPAGVIFRNFGKHELRILAQMAGAGFNNYQLSRPEDLNEFVKRYPTPIDFEEPSEEFLQIIKESNPDKKYQEYIESMRSFKNYVYGKQQEYWDQQNGGPEKTASKELPNEYLQGVRIDGDVYPIENAKEVTAEDLVKVGLGPQHEVVLDKENVKIGFSDILEICNHKMVVGYVKTEDGVFARPYYQSRSAGLWRHLPDYMFDSGSKEVEHFGKGYSEESLTLPYQVQESLDQISSDPNNTMDATGLDQYVFGLARNDSKDRSGLVRRGSYFREVSAHPIMNFGNLHAHDKTSPEKNTIAEEMMPDFSNEISSHLSHNDIYGDYYSRQFMSKNQQLTWTMCETVDRGERCAWVGGVEVNSPITSTGCHSEWVSMGDFCTPLYEYNTQAGEYGEREHRKGQYVRMWDNYLSKMPVIQEYIDKTELKK